MEADGKTSLTTRAAQGGPHAHRLDGLSPADHSSHHGVPRGGNLYHTHYLQPQQRLAHADGGLTVGIRDDGRGGADLLRGTGLTGMVDRVAAAGGSMSLTSPLGAAP